MSSRNLLLNRQTRRTTGSVDRESVQALEAAQNPHLTAQETSQTTTTQILDPKQSEASVVHFVQITEVGHRSATGRCTKRRGTFYDVP